jgi:hypothetical protein
MSDSYDNNIRVLEIASGTRSGSWGTLTNTNLNLIGQALGYATEASFASNANATTTVPNGSTHPARAMYFKVTSGADLTTTRVLTIAPNNMSRVMFIENATSGSQSIDISQGTGANVTIPTGNTKIVYLDGAGSGAAVVDALNLTRTVTKSGSGTYISMSGNVITADLVNLADSTNDITGNLASANQPTHIYSGVQAIGNSSGATIALNWNNGNMATITNNGAPSSISAPSNPASGGNYALMIKAASGAASSFTWPSNFKWRENTAPTLTTTTNHSDVITLIYDGTNYLASFTNGHPS